MSLEKMDLRDLVEDMVDISTLVDEAQESQSVHAPPSIRARGKAQLPILQKVEEILSEELDRRLGHGEMAEVAIDAMANQVEAMRELKEAEKREALGGRTIAELEQDTREFFEKFEAEHPEVLYDRQMLHTAKANIERELAKEDPLGQWRGDPVAAAIDRDFLQPHPAINGERDWSPRQPELCIRDSGSWPVGTTSPTHKLKVTEAPSSILQAMKNACWSTIQRLGENTLVEYLELWEEKHHDYGSENHAIWGAKGCVIRLTDKLMRLKGQYFDGRVMKNRENDWLDLIGYGLIGLVIERGQWPVTTLEAVMEDMKDKTAPPENILDIYCPCCSHTNIRIRSTRLFDAGPHNCFAFSLVCQGCGTVATGSSMDGEGKDTSIRRIAHEWHRDWEAQT